MASSYYNSSGKEVFDGDVAYADDLNAINSAVDSAFQLAETDIDGMVADVEFWATTAEGHATDAAADAVQTAADRVQTGLDRTSATNSANSATSSASSASTSASTATTKAALAEQWAEEAEDVEVTTGKYSALHWAAKAAASAGIQTITGTGVDNSDPNNPVITITKSTISLGNVDNTSDANKPVSTATQSALDLKAPISSPTFTDVPAAPTASVGTNTTQIATTAFVLANQTPAPTFLHVQDQKAYNVAGGSMVADTWTVRVLNTSVKNTISGASLGSNQITLPAGTYEIDAEQVWVAPGSATAFVAAIFVDGTKSDIQSVTHYVGSGFGNMPVRCGGQVTLAAPGYIELKYYAGDSRATDGLGLSNNTGSITDASILSVYSDVKVWKVG